MKGQSSIMPFIKTFSVTSVAVWLRAFYIQLLTVV